MALHAVTEATGPGWQESQAATLQHIALLKRKRARLLAAQIEAENQLLHAVAGACRPEQRDKTELAAVYGQYATDAGPDHQERWDRVMPVSAATMERWVDCAPNGPFGTWLGESDSLWGVPHPKDGVCVVYVLFDADNVPCYVGSTHDLPTRFKKHRRDKRFRAWTAYRCEDREAAYALEDKLLSEYQPYLNKRAAR